MQTSFHGVNLTVLRNAALEEYFKQPILVSLFGVLRYLLRMYMYPTCMVKVVTHYLLLCGEVLMVFLHSRAEIHMNLSVNVVLNDGCLRLNLWLCTLFGFGVVSV